MGRLREAVMVAKPCLILYGNSVFLAGIKAELEGDYELGLELLSVEAGHADVTDLLRQQKPSAVIFDLGMDQPSVAISTLCELPRMLLIGVDVNKDEMLVLSSRPARARSIADLLRVIRRKDSEVSGRQPLKPRGRRKAE